MSTDVIGYLTSKGLELKRADKKNINTACFYCGEASGKRGRLYINVDEDADVPGLHFCHLCGEHGSLTKIKRYFGDPVSDATDPGATHYEILRAAATYYHKALNQHPEAVRYYEDRGLEHATIKKFQLGWADGKVVPHLKSLGHTESEIRSAGLFWTDKQNNDHEFFRDCYVIPYLIGPTVVGLRLKEPGGKYKQPQGFGQRLFNIDAAYGADELVITEGEFDCMIAVQMGYAAIGSPGATQWQEGWNQYLKEIKRVYAVFDNDEAGRKGVDRIREMAGPKVRGLTIPPKQGGDDEDHNDLSDWIVQEKHTPEDFAALLKKHKGSLLITVGEAMTEWDSVQGLQGLKFGFETLDTMLNPGLLPGQVVVALAKTNTGKTLWLENTFERMAQHNDDLKFLFLSLEQTRGEWFERAQRHRGFYLQNEMAPTSFDDEEMGRYDKAIRRETFDFWNTRFLMTDKNRMTEDHIREVLEDYVQEMGTKPDVVAIDYLGYLARGFKGKDRYEKTSEAIMVVKAIAKDVGIPILTPHQVNRTGQFGQKLEIDMARDAGSVEETADFVFVLYNPDHGLDPSDPNRTGKINMHVGKSRHGGKSREVHYQFGRQTLVMVPPDDSTFYSLALEERKLVRDEPWQWTLCRHRTGKRPPVS